MNCVAHGILPGFHPDVKEAVSVIEHVINPGRDGTSALVEALPADVATGAAAV